jgi:hypothetical protein
VISKGRLQGARLRTSPNALRSSEERLTFRINAYNILAIAGHDEIHKGSPPLFKAGCIH